MLLSMTQMRPRTTHPETYWIETGGRGSILPERSPRPGV